MRILQVSPSLPVDVCTQAACLSDRGHLHRLYTSTAVNHRGLGGRLVGRWLGRRVVEIEPGRLKPVFSSDLHQRLAQLRGSSRVVSVDERFERVDRAASRGTGAHLDAVLCREDAADHTFRRADECGVLRIYDLPTAHFELTRRLLQAELEAFPEFEAAVAMEDEYATDRIARKCRELALADHILCPSNFVRRSLVEAGFDSGKIQVIPFACHARWAPPLRTKPTKVVLSVGQISVRKGSHRLLEAWKRTGAHRTHTLRLVGDMQLPRHFLRRFDGSFEHEGPIPRDALIKEYARADFCVFNNMSEGMAVVIGEALSAGSPVIATRNSGAEEIIANEEEGILIEYGDDDALADAITRLLESPRRLEQMRECARERARSRTWDDYAREFVTWLDSTVPAAVTAGAA